MISTVITFFVVVFGLVLLYMILTWGMAKMGITLEPAVKNILIGIVCLILLVLFLNWTGYWHPGNLGLNNR